jgi:acetyl-CoA acetyltransferase
MLTGSIPATQKLLERNGLAMDDIDLVEINEASPRWSLPGRELVTTCCGGGLGTGTPIQRI